MTVLAELGAVGAALLAWLAVAASRMLSDRRAPRAWTRAVIGATLVAAFVHSLLTGSLMEDPIVWTLLAAGCAVGSRPATNDPSPLGPVPELLRRLAAANLRLTAPARTALPPVAPTLAAAVLLGFRSASGEVGIQGQALRKTPSGPGVKCEGFER